MAASLVRPDYSTKIVDNSTKVIDYSNRPAAEDTIGPLPVIKLAIPKTNFQVPKNGLPINPSPHTWVVDPAIQVPSGGRVSPSPLDQYISPSVEQRGFLSPRDVSPKRFVDYPLSKATQTDAYNFSRSSSQDSLDCCQYCPGCRRRVQHRRSNTDSSITSSIISSSPNISSPETTEVPKRSSSAFGRKFKFNVLQRASSRNSVDIKGRYDDEKKARKKSISTAPTKKPAKKIAFTMVGSDDHWADEY
jgi:hypothetical protein